MADTNAGALKRVFETGDYSDFVISTPDKKFKVHRNILCVKSDYFKAAWAGSFTEANSGRIKLEEEGCVIEPS